MDETQLADLNDIQDFFNRSHSTEKIDIKNFIGWCNNPCKNISEDSPHSDPAYKLGETVRELNKLNENKLKEMESALKEDRWDEWCKNSGIKEASADDAVFYLVLKCRTDDQRHYNFYFDKDAVAELDAFDPFTEDENGQEVLDQQWHVLISVLALLDVAHALSNEQYEYHCLYQYIKKWDTIDLNADELQFYRGTSGKPELHFNTKEGKMIRRYKAPAMNKWLETALRRP